MTLGRFVQNPLKGEKTMSRQPVENGNGTFDECGTVLFDLQDTPLTATDIEQLRLAAFEIPREHIGVGDTGEECELEVGRVMVDVTKATIVNPLQSERILPIVASEKMASWVAEKTAHAGSLYVRRCAINYMPKGGVVGEHDDGETNPDYLYFVVLHLNETFDGGEFYSTHYKTKKKIEFSNNNKLCLSRCNLRHGVKRVTAGVRASLIWFYADRSAPEVNRRNYSSNPLPAESAAATGFGGRLKTGSM
jgi:hypothetical protein